jgi:predicted nucleic acid-binding protein
LNSLLDTNLVSEMRRPVPEPKVIAWLAGVDFQTCFLSVVTLQELRFGVERLPQGQRRAVLTAWLEGPLVLQFDDHILPITVDIADVCGRIQARCLSLGRPMAVLDAYLAATAEVHDLTVVTRNTRDFEAWGGVVFNPWL